MHGNMTSKMDEESPIFNYINNLSHIKLVKGTSVIQFFPALNSPPLVFTSPRINTHRHSIENNKEETYLKGDIGVAKNMDNGVTWEQLGVALDEDWHLSHPYVFDYNH